MTVATWRELLQEPASSDHLVQLYRDEGFLKRGVASWVAPGLARGGGALLICTAENARLVRDELRARGIDPAPFEQAGRLTFLDADETLGRILRGGLSDGVAFRLVIEPPLRRVQAACAPGAPPVRAWGEMVNLLWLRNDLPAAKRLETLWNEVIAEHGFNLLCSYQVDNLDPATHQGVLREVCHGHTHLIPEEDDVRFNAAVDLALEDVFGAEAADTVRAVFGSRRAIPIGMPPAEAVLVALHDMQPVLGARVLRAARQHLEGPAAPGPTA